MTMPKAALAAIASLFAAPAFASNGFNENAPRALAIATVFVGNQEVELVAATERGRGAGPLRQKDLEKRQALGKVWPGYPQPALLNIHMRVKF